MKNRLLIIVLMITLQADCIQADDTTSRRHIMASWTSVTVGVASLEQALKLWVDTFGFEIAASSEGNDPDLERLWGLEAGDIEKQALLRTPGQSRGMLHLVQFHEPDPPVRAGAQVFDSCPKNLDIYVHDLPRRHQELLAAGHTFRTETYSDLTAPNGVRFREIHLLSHDEINVVLLELVGVELPFTEQGYAGVGPLITIVENAEKEKDFYLDIIELEQLSNNILDGPEIEKMIGLPAGAALDVSIWGVEDQPLGQVEIIDYRGVEGANLYPGAQPKSLGILHISYIAADLELLTAKLDDRNIEWASHGQTSTLAASGRAIHFHSPAGFRIEVFSE